jgi:K+-sensing histidine kinase KdpD
VKKTRINFLDFEVDKLNRSIENVVTGDSFATSVSHLLKSDLKVVTQKRGWLFNWKTELDAPEKEAYKLTIQDNSTVIQGLVSLIVDIDHYIKTFYIKGDMEGYWQKQD